MFVHNRLGRRDACGGLTDGRGNSCLIKAQSQSGVPASARHSLHFNNIRESLWLQLQLSSTNTSTTRLIRAAGLKPLLSLSLSLLPSSMTTSLLIGFCLHILYSCCFLSWPKAKAAIGRPVHSFIRCWRYVSVKVFRAALLSVRSYMHKKNHQRV